jgi:hypothetical protein
MVVVYKDGREEIVSNPALFPDNHDATMRIDRVEEPIGMSNDHCRFIAYGF